MAEIVDDMVAARRKAAGHVKEERAIAGRVRRMKYIRKEGAGFSKPNIAAMKEGRIVFSSKLRIAGTSLGLTVPFTLVDHFGLRHHHPVRVEIFDLEGSGN